MTYQPFLRQAFSVPIDSTTLCTLWHNIKNEHYETNITVPSDACVTPPGHVRMSCVLFRTAERHTVGEYFDLQTMKWLHQQIQLNLTWSAHRQLLEQCHRLTDGYFAVQDVGTLAAPNGAVRVQGITNTNTSTITTSVSRICINTCVLCLSCNHNGLKFPKKKIHKIWIRLHNSLQPHQKSQAPPQEILQLSNKVEYNTQIWWNINEMELCPHIAIIVL